MFPLQLFVMSGQSPSGFSEKQVTVAKLFKFSIIVPEAMLFDVCLDSEGCLFHMFANSTIEKNENPMHVEYYLPGLAEIGRDSFTNLVMKVMWLVLILSQVNWIFFTALCDRFNR